MNVIDNDFIGNEENSRGSDSESPIDKLIKKLENTQSQSGKDEESLKIINNNVTFSGDIADLVKLLTASTSLPSDKPGGNQKTMRVKLYIHIWEYAMLLHLTEKETYKFLCSMTGIKVDGLSQLGQEELQLFHNVMKIKALNQGSV